MKITNHYLQKEVFYLIKKVEICGVNTSKLPVLSNEEKNELFKLIKQGDEEAREKFINGNLRLVLSVIQRFRGKRRKLRRFISSRVYWTNKSNR